MRGVKAAGWLPPISEDARDRYRTHMARTGREPSKEEWAQWEREVQPSSRGFPTKKVKQKRQRLAADGGGEYEVEIDVADLTMERRVEQVIPKGPRAGERISKVQKQGINKIIGGLEKKGDVPEGSAQWWAKNQTFYTKDRNHTKIDALLTDPAKSENMHVILSRHPIDVLRMSDISNIRSCHSEGSEYFQCAVAEAKGHGPIAYAVTETELNKLLTPSEEREKPIAKLDRMYDTMGQAERITQIRQDYDTESPEGALVLLWVWSRSNHGSKWWNDLDKRVEMAAKPEKFKEVALISKAKELNISPELFKQYIKNYEDAWNSGMPGFKPYEGITSKEEYDAALQKHSEEATRAPDKVDISSFDDEEIFRDNTRGIEGIGASARVRLRKYVDSENDLTFAAPESRTYGRGIPGFVAAVREHVWDKQKGLFAQELGDAEGEATTYFVPDEYNLTRYGGSYGDTRDGEILSMFWNLAGDEYEDRFDYGSDVDHESGSEEEDEAERLYEEWSETIDDLNDTANNELENASFGAYVHEADWGDQPYVSADGTLTLSIDLGFGEEGRGYEIPENSWGGDAREFANSTLDLGNEYPEEVNWELDEGVLRIDYRFSCEDCNEPNDADYFLDYMRELDGKYDELYEKVRRKLVSDGYAKPNAWDNTTSEVEDFEDKLKNFNIIGDDPDDPSGEIWFNLGRGHGNGDPEMPLDIKVNKEKMYWLTKSPRNNYSTISRSVLRTQFSQLMASAIGGSKERRVVWVGPDTNSSFARFFTEKLKKLEAAANGYAEKQLDFPFGDKYSRPQYEGVDFAKDVRLGLVFAEGTENVTEVPILFKFRIIATSKDSKEELEGAFHFVEFVDEHVDMLLQAAREVTEEFVLEPNYEISEELKKEYFSGRKALDLSANIMQRANHYAEELAKSVQAIAEWWSNNDGAIWEDMNVYEKEVLVERYLTPMSNGRQINWDKQKHLPQGWEQELRAWLNDAGVAGAIINKMDMSRHADEAVTTKFFGSKEEIIQKRVDYELGIASRRYETVHGKPPDQELLEAWAKEIARQLGVGEFDIPKFRQDSIRGTMGAPRPAESIDRRVAYLKKQLTEAKIRGKIRKIIKEAE